MAPARPRRGDPARGGRPGRLRVLGLAAGVGALGLRLLLGSPPAQGEVGAALAARGLEALPEQARWVPTGRPWLGVERGSFYVIARSLEAPHGDLWRAAAARAPSGRLLWLGPPARLSATPAVTERLVAADADGALVWSRGGQGPGFLRWLSPEGQRRAVWRTPASSPPAIQGPLAALEALGPAGYRPVDRVLARHAGGGPEPRPPAPLGPQAVGATPLPAPPRWPPAAPWQPLVIDAQGVVVAQGRRVEGVEVYAFHPDRYRGTYVWGASGPEAGDGSLGSGHPAAPEAVRFTLDAEAVGDAGLMVADRPVRPLRRGAGTLALDEAGRAGFGLWDLDGPQAPWASVVQRPAPLVVEGRLMPGRPLSAAAGALGVTPDGSWLYAAAAGPGVGRLGAALAAAGAALALTVSAADAPTVQHHPEGLAGPTRTLSGRTAPRPEVAAAGYFALLQRPSRALGEGFAPLEEGAERPAIGRRPGAVTLWRLDDDRLTPALSPGPEPAGWIGLGARPVQGVDGARVGGAALRPMRPRALTLCGPDQPRLVVWREADAAGCPEALQGLTLVSEGRIAPGAYGTSGEVELGLGRDAAGRWLLGRQPRGDRAALAKALAEAGAQAALLLGEGSPAAEGWLRWGELAPPEPGLPEPRPPALLYLRAGPGRPTAAPLERFDRAGCPPRRLLRCDVEGG